MLSRLKSKVHNLLKHIVIIVFFSGCLVTEDFDFKIEENMSPMIVPEKVSPRLNTIVPLDLSQEESSIEFKIREIRDPNIMDTLYVRYFVDYDEKINYRPADLYEVPPSGKVSRFPGITTVKLDKKAFQDYGCHIVEVVVSDRKFIETPKPRRSIPPGGKSDTRYWWVLAHDGDPIKTKYRCPESCPECKEE
jgi:hypothetical protein